MFKRLGAFHKDLEWKRQKLFLQKFLNVRRSEVSEGVGDLLR